VELWTADTGGQFVLAVRQIAQEHPASAARRRATDGTGRGPVLASVAADASRGMLKIVSD